MSGIGILFYVLVGKEGGKYRSFCHFVVWFLGGLQSFLAALLSCFCYVVFVSLQQLGFGGSAELVFEPLGFGGVQRVGCVAGPVFLFSSLLTEACVVRRPLVLTQGYACVLSIIYACVVTLLGCFFV